MNRQITIILSTQEIANLEEFFGPGLHASGSLEVAVHAALAGWAEGERQQRAQRDPEAIIADVERQAKNAGQAVRRLLSNM